MQWADRVGRRLKLRDLHILLAVVRRGSMANAAGDLAISQPAVSKAIADMENALGVRLLDRTRNGVEPTVYGRALVRRGLAIFDELKLGVEELAFLANPSVGELLIGSTESIAAGLLPAAMDRFSREHPRVHLTVRQAVINTLHYRELRERSIDLFLGRIPSPFAEDDLEAEIIYNDPVVIVAGARSKWARTRRTQSQSPCFSRRAMGTPTSRYDRRSACAGSVLCQRDCDAVRAGHDPFDPCVLSIGCDGTIHHHFADVHPTVWRRQSYVESLAH
jgi:DNA-binding transcriptional LysR family regulator